MVASRAALLIVQALIALTSAAGGVALMLGPRSASVGISPPRAYLEGSPFDSFFVPGLVLLVVVGGTHLVAFILMWRRSRAALTASAVAGFGILIWIFVQMVIIPFSVLQALYFGAGLLELALVLVLLGVLNPRSPLPHNGGQQVEAASR